MIVRAPPNNAEGENKNEENTWWILQICKQ